MDSKLLKSPSQLQAVNPQELQRLRLDVYGDAAEEALSYLHSQSPELVELLQDSGKVSASGTSMAAPVG